MTEEKTCAERLSDRLDSRMEDLTALWESMCNGEDEHEELGNLFDYGLSFDYVAPDTFPGQDAGYFRYQISWGGPSSEFRYYVGAGFESYKVEFWFLDWGDGASRTLYDEYKDTMLAIFGMFKEMGIVEAEFDRAMEA